MEFVPRLFGPYVLLEQLGAGGMGDALLAKPVRQGSGVPEPVVVKRMHQHLTRDRTFLQRFRHEAQVAALIDSPYIARVYDAGSVMGTYYIAMEYIYGATLATVARTLLGRGSLPPVRWTLAVVRSTLCALEVLHEALHPTTGQPLRIVHRDVSPKNVMLGDDGHARVIDLGIGKSSLQEWRTRTGELFGAPGYMAPEQVSGGLIDHRTDLYAAAIILFELLTLENFIPREGIIAMLSAAQNPTIKPPSAKRGDLPDGVDELVAKGLAADPRDRFQTAREFRMALEQIDEDLERPVVLPELQEEISAQTLLRREEIEQLLTIRIPPRPREDSRARTFVIARAPGVALDDRGPGGDSSEEDTLLRATGSIDDIVPEDPE